MIDVHCYTPVCYIDHELWWLDGRFHMANKKHDTKEKIVRFVTELKESIGDGRVVGSYSYSHPSLPNPLLFTHAGLRVSFLPVLLKISEMGIGSPLSMENMTASALSEHINSLLVLDTAECRSRALQRCNLQSEVYQAGRERVSN